MPDSKVQQTGKQTKKEPTIRFGDETNKNRTEKYYIHNMVSQTDVNMEFTSIEATMAHV